MSFDAEVRFWNYVQVKKTSTENYVKEKFRLFLLWRLSKKYYHETKRLFEFPNSQSADAFLAKWQNGDFDVPSARGTIFSRPPALCIDPNLFLFNFFFSLKRGLRKQCVQKKLNSWFSDRVTSGDYPTFEEILTKATELEEQRKSEKRERKLVRRQLLASMQQDLIDNICLNFGN